MILDQRVVLFLVFKEPHTVSPSGCTSFHFHRQCRRYIVFSTASLKCKFPQSCPTLFVTPWTVACQAPLSRDFCRQEYWSGLPFPFPRDLPNPGIKPTSPALAGGFFTTEPPRKLSLQFIEVYTNIGFKLSELT